MNILSIRSLSKYYNNVQILKECSLDVNKGDIIVVCGPSGSGKSTLIKCINALERFQSGEIIFNGVSLSQKEVDINHIRTKIGMVFQSYELFPHIKVIDNITLAPMKVLKQSKETAQKKAIELLERVGMTAHAQKYPGQLSGGQKQRIAIARSLAMEPDLMLFDEPTSALDPEMTQEVLGVMTQLAQEGMTMIIVTHEISFAQKIANRIVFIDKGEIVENCTSNEFFSGKQSERVIRFLSIL